MTAMRRTTLAVVAVLALAVAGCKTPKSKASREVLGTPERAVTRLVRAIEAGDTGMVEVQFPHEMDMEKYLSCAVPLRDGMNGLARQLVDSPDGKAAKGTFSSFVSVELTRQRKVAPGPFEGDCKVLKEFEVADADSTWDMDGEKHHFKLSLIRLDGRWYVFDIPGM